MEREKEGKRLGGEEGEERQRRKRPGYYPL